MIMGQSGRCPERPMIMKLAGARASISRSASDNHTRRSVTLKKGLGMPHHVVAASDPFQFPATFA